MNSKAEARCVFSSLKQKIKENRKRLIQEKGEKVQLLKPEGKQGFVGREKGVRGGFSKCEKESSIGGVSKERQESQWENVKFQGCKRLKKHTKISINKQEQENKVIRLNLNQLVIRQNTNQGRNQRVSSDKTQAKSDRRSRSRSQSQGQSQSDTDSFLKKRSLSTYSLPKPVLFDTRFPPQSKPRTKIFNQQQQPSQFQRIKSIKTFQVQSVNPITHPPYYQDPSRKMFPGKNQTDPHIYTEHQRSNPNLYTNPQGEVMILRERNKTPNRNSSQKRQNYSTSVMSLGQEKPNQVQKKQFEGKRNDRVKQIIRHF